VEQRVEGTVAQTVLVARSLLTVTLFCVCLGQLSRTVYSLACSSFSFQVPIHPLHFTRLALTPMLSMFLGLWIQGFKCISTTT